MTVAWSQRASLQNGPLIDHEALLHLGKINPGGNTFPRRTQFAFRLRQKNGNPRRVGNPRGIAEEKRVRGQAQAGFFVQLAGKGLLIRFPEMSQAAGKSQAQPITALHNEEAVVTANDRRRAAQRPENREAAISGNAGSRDQAKQPLLPAPGHGRRLSGYYSGSTGAVSLANAVRTFRREPRSESWPGSTCESVFSLQEGTFACLPASKSLTNKQPKVERVMPWTHITAAMAAISFWLTVALAAASSLLSALCIYDPVFEPKHDPYFFIGQWLIWLTTPLLWGTVAPSSSVEWLKAFDPPLVLALAAICRGAAQAVCNLKWRGKTSRRVPRVVYVTRPQGHS